MTEVDVEKVVGAIMVPTCLAMRLKMDEREELLEAMMPLEDAPAGDDVAESIQGDTPFKQ